MEEHGANGYALRPEQQERDVRLAEQERNKLITNVINKGALLVSMFCFRVAVALLICERGPGKVTRSLWRACPWQEPKVTPVRKSSCMLRTCWEGVSSCSAAHVHVASEREVLLFLRFVLMQDAKGHTSERHAVHRGHPVHLRRRPHASGSVQPLSVMWIPRWWTRRRSRLL